MWPLRLQLVICTRCSRAMLVPSAPHDAGTLPLRPPLKDRNKSLSTGNAPFRPQLSGNGPCTWFTPYQQGPCAACQCAACHQAGGGDTVIGLTVR